MLTGGCLVTKLCLTLVYDPMDCSLADSSVHEILQARILVGISERIMKYDDDICFGESMAWGKLVSEKSHFILNTIHID